MPAKSQQTGWRAFSGLCQAAVGSAQTVNSRFFYEGDPLEPEIDTYYENKNQITGALMATTETRALNRKLTGAHKAPATPHLVGMLASMVLGKCTTTQIGATAAYRHKLEIENTMVALPTRTMVEYDGDTQKRFTGVACTGFKLSGARGAEVMFEATLLGRGDEATDVTAIPARVAESYLFYGDATLVRGGTYDGTVVTGGTALSARVVDFELEVKNNGVAKHLVGDSSGNAGELRRGKDFDVMFKAKLEIEDAADRNALLAGTEYVLSLPIVGGVAAGANNFTILTVLPKVVYKTAKKGVSGESILELSCEFLVKRDATYGAIQTHVINLQTANYLATA